MLVTRGCKLVERVTQSSPTLLKLSSSTDSPTSWLETSLESESPSVLVPGKVMESETTSVSVSGMRMESVLVLVSSILLSGSTLPLCSLLVEETLESAFIKVLLVQFNDSGYYKLKR